VLAAALKLPEVLAVLGAAAAGEALSDVLGLAEVLAMLGPGLRAAGVLDPAEVLAVDVLPQVPARRARPCLSSCPSCSAWREVLAVLSGSSRTVPEATRAHPGARFCPGFGPAVPRRSHLPAHHRRGKGFKHGVPAGQRRVWDLNPRGHSRALAVFKPVPELS
jgi:hypothetical protein